MPYTNLGVTRKLNPGDTLSGYGALSQYLTTTSHGAAVLTRPKDYKALPMRDGAVIGAEAEREVNRSIMHKIAHPFQQFP